LFLVLGWAACIKPVYDATTMTCQMLNSRTQKTPRCSFGRSDVSGACLMHDQWAGLCEKKSATGYGYALPHISEHQPKSKSHFSAGTQ
jgi:hypothetical protein